MTNKHCTPEPYSPAFKFLSLLSLLFLFWQALCWQFIIPFFSTKWVRAQTDFKSLTYIDVTRLQVLLYLREREEVGEKDLDWESGEQRRLTEWKQEFCVRIIVGELGLYGCWRTGKLMTASVVHICRVMGLLLLMSFLYGASRKLWLAKMLRVALKAPGLKWMCLRIHQIMED